MSRGENTFGDLARIMARIISVGRALSDIFLAKQLLGIAEQLLDAHTAGLAKNRLFITERLQRANDILMTTAHISPSVSVEALATIDVIKDLIASINLIQPRKRIRRVARKDSKISSKTVVNDMASKKYAKQNEFEKLKQKILEILTKDGPLSASDLDKRFPEISRRTMLRQITELLGSKMVRRTGGGRTILYTTVPHGSSLHGV